MTITKIKLHPRNTLQAKIRTGFAGSIVAGNGISLTHVSNVYTISATLNGTFTGTWAGTPIGVTFGGTGLTSYTTGDMLYASSPTVLAKLAAGTSGYAILSNGAGVAPSYQGYLQGGFGAATRTWQAKAREVISVTDFGAVDGAADNDAAFQAAMTYANSYAFGSSVHVPSGTWKISTAITVPDRVRWYGNGASSNIMMTNLTAHVFNVTGGETRIHDLQVSTSVLKTAGAVIKVTTGGGLFYNIYSSGAGGVNGFWNGLETNSAAWWQLDRCRFKFIRNAGVYSTGGAGADLGWITNSTVEGGDYGLLAKGTSNIKIRGTEFVGCDIGMAWVPDAAETVISMNVLGGTIVDNCRIGMKIGGAGVVVRSYVHDLQATSCSEYGVHITGSVEVDGLDFTNLKCLDSGIDGLLYDNTTASGILIKGGIFAANDGKAINIAANCGGISISDTIVGPWGDWPPNALGIDIAAGTGNNIRISDTDLSGNTGANFACAATGNDIRLNNVKGYDNVLTPAQITADQDDYGPLGIMWVDTIRISSDAVRAIKGIKAPAYAKRLRVQNIGSFRDDLHSAGGTSLAANQFSFPAAAGVSVIPNHGCVDLIYDPALANWVLDGMALQGGTSTTVLHGAANGLPTYGPVVLATDVSDYAVGTWTPVLTCATPGDLAVTYSIQLGDYTKIGREVRASFQIVTSAFTHTTASGAVSITGLPFAVAATGFNFTGAINFGGITKVGFTQFGSVVVTTTVQLRAFASGSAANVVNIADLPTGGTVNLQATVVYHV